MKTLDNYNAALGPVTLVFQIEGVDEHGETVYSNVLATTHSAAGTQSAVAEQIRRELMSQSQRSTAEPAMNWCPKGRRQA